MVDSVLQELRTALRMAGNGGGLHRRWQLLRQKRQVHAMTITITESQFEGRPCLMATVSTRRWFFWSTIKRYVCLRVTLYRADWFDLESGQAVSEVSATYSKLNRAGCKWQLAKGMRATA